MRWFQLVTCSVLVVLLGMATLAGASAIAIVNPSFEDPAFANPGEADVIQGTGDFHGWNVTSIGGSGSAAVIARILNPPVANPPTADDNVGRIVPEGLNVFCHYNDNVRELEVRQSLTAQYEANTMYTLSMDVGQYSVGQYRGYAVALASDNGTYLAGVTNNKTLFPGSAWTLGSTPAAGTWNTVTTTFTTGDSGGVIGEDIMVRFGTAGGSSAPGFRGAFDNVILTASPIPEPSTMMLVLTGLIGLVCYAWRKRR